MSLFLILLILFCLGLFDMKNPYNTDEMVEILEKCYTDFKEFKERFYLLDNGTGNYDTHYDNLSDIDLSIRDAIKLLKARGYKLNIELEPGLF